MEYQYHILKNGIRVIHKAVPGKVGHCGVFINTGSRDEEEDEGGMAHFIEHVIFKGTKKRKSFHVLNRLESVGGDLNAFTTKEETCVYASFLNEYYGRTLELFSDIIFQSVFPEKEIEKEKDVVIDEIYSYKDSPSEEIFDEFEDLVFEGHSLGRNILGTKKEVKRIDRKKVLKFVQKHYNTEGIVIASVGNIAFPKLIKQIERYFDDIPMSSSTNHRTAFDAYQPKIITKNRNSYLSHCMIGTECYSRTHADKSAMVLLNNILGGPGLNSRLNLSVREKYGFTYSIESNFQPYSDTGVFNIYLGTDPAYLEKSIKLVNQEMKRLCTQKLGAIQLSVAKKQFFGQLAVSFESNLNEMLSIGKSYLLYENVDSIEGAQKRVDRIDADRLITVANQVFDLSNMSQLVYEGEDK